MTGKSRWGIVILFSVSYVIYWHWWRFVFYMLGVISIHPVLVVVDSSFHMKSVWQQVSDVLKNLSSLRYAEFSLITEKNSVHGWSLRLNLGKVSPYAPRSFSKLEGKGNYPAIEEAGEIFFLPMPTHRWPKASADGTSYALNNTSVYRILKIFLLN